MMPYDFGVNEFLHLKCIQIAGEDDDDVDDKDEKLGEIVSGMLFRCIKLWADEGDVPDDNWQCASKQMPIHNTVHRHEWHNRK